MGFPRKNPDKIEGQETRFDLLPKSNITKHNASEVWDRMQSSVIDHIIKKSKAEQSPDKMVDQKTGQILFKPMVSNYHTDRTLQKSGIHNYLHKDGQTFKETRKQLEVLQNEARVQESMFASQMSLLGSKSATLTQKALKDSIDRIFNALDHQK